MILTGKCLEDFLKWAYSEYDIKLCDILNMYPFTMHNSLIVDWFDTVGVTIGIEDESKNLSSGMKDCDCNDENCCFDFYVHSFFCTIKHYDKNNQCGDYETFWTDHYEKRKLATNAAIEKANEIYNEKHK